MNDDKPRCREPATLKVYWPGREPLNMCPRHGGMAVNVSTALGTYLHTEDADDRSVCAHLKEGV